MSESNHTPGPWEIRTRVDGTRSITGAYHFPRGEHPLAGGILHVCDLSGDKHHDDANARLIAAAPEMYEALTNIYGWLMSVWTPEDMEGGAVNEEFKKAYLATRAALSKAEGRS